MPSNNAANLAAFLLPAIYRFLTPIPLKPKSLITLGNIYILSVKSADLAIKPNT
ncbi:hypothetical protein [Shewanella sp. ANA-3]|uniref:hypothetical protein n=1 Tax=Shewanella sp. (strain ANA-3) TaxID=94122 RepID=UPI0002E2A9CD|nr:hypothetical protein [Shewanella sp. ANA-3]